MACIALSGRSNGVEAKRSHAPIGAAYRSVSSFPGSWMRTDRLPGLSYSRLPRRLPVLVATPLTEPTAAINVLGVSVDALNMQDALQFIDRAIATNSQTYICVTGVHGIMESQADAELRNIHNRAGLVVPDGMPLVWLGRLQGHSEMDRVYGPDLLLELCQHSITRGYRHFFYGGGESVAEDLAQQLQRRFPGLQVSGTLSPPFRPLTQDEELDLFARVSDGRTDIVWIGLSTPKQERFMASVVGRMPAHVMIGVGAAFDFHSGRKRQAPYWMQRSGLEWLFRLASEPGRLWKRYLTNNPRFVVSVIAQSLGLRKYEI